MTPLPDQGVVVVGAGAAGIAAAIAAARKGVDVLLVEKSGRLGGTVTHSLIHTIGGLYDSYGNTINEGLPAELVGRLMEQGPASVKRKIGRAWTLSVSPEHYERVVESWLAELPRLRVLRNASVQKVLARTHSVHSVELLTMGKPLRREPAAVVDATGTAEVIRMIDPSLVRNGPGVAGGLIFTMRGVDPEVLRFPASLGLLRKIRSAAEAGRIPKDCAMTWVDRGVQEDEAFIKLFVPMGATGSGQESLRAAEQRALFMRDALVALLAADPAFSSATVGRTGRLGIREGGHVKGTYCLTENDVRSGRRFADAAARCCWPMEYWDPSDGVKLEYLPLGEYYEIPLRALSVRNLDNVWIAGKCLSAEPRAQASARVAGTCWAMGEAAGEAAAGRCGQTKKIPTEFRMAVRFSANGAAFGPPMRTRADYPPDDHP